MSDMQKELLASAKPQLEKMASNICDDFMKRFGEQIDSSHQGKIQERMAAALEEARAAWEAQPGLTLMDDPPSGSYPTPLDCAAQDATFLGRARQDVSNPNGLAFWCVTDNLRKGAALNIVQMVEWMQAHDCL